MLVLKRKRGSRVMIDGGRIILELVEAGDGWAKLGFIADPAIPIWREEIDHGEPSAAGSPTLPVKSENFAASKPCEVAKIEPLPARNEVP